ncbi:MAG: Gldg family protein [Myxococcales bacterium]|jgi:ABC-type uncharacterized transport system involved in gliding motility auxiliary subunit
MAANQSATRGTTHEGASKTKSRLKSESTLFLLVLAAIVVTLNALGLFGLKGRVDVTDKQLFTLSEGSKRVARSLEDRMEIRAYFSDDLPPPFNASGRYVRDILSEYRDASGGKISVTMIAPKTEEEKEAAERDGVQRVRDRKIDPETDSFGFTEGYRGISFSYLGDTRAIPRVDSTAGLEYEITQTIKELAGEKVKVGVLGGHGSPTPSEGLTNLAGYLPTYTLEEVKADKPIPNDIEALLVLHPEDTLSEVELRHIDKYVMEGGSLAVFGGGVKIDPGAQGGNPTATPIDSGLNGLLEKWGVTLDNRIVADAQCGQARLPSPIPGLAIPVPYPPVPIVSFTEEQQKHPALFEISQVRMPWPVRVAVNDNLKGDDQVTTTVLARSTENSWMMEGDSIDLKARERWAIPGYSGPYTLGVSIEGKLPSAFAGEFANASVDPNDPQAQAAAAIQAPERATEDVRVLVFGSGYFIRDQFLPKPQPGMNMFVSDVAFMLNSIDWLTQDEDLIAIRAKNVAEPMLEIPREVKQAEAQIREAAEEQDEAKVQEGFEKRKEAVKSWNKRKNAYKWGNTLAIPMAFALFGVVRWRMRLAKKANLEL